MTKIKKQMSNLIVDADLTEPPSETAVFRDVTLYAKVFLNHDVLIECDRDVVDLYWYWLKRRGAFFQRPSRNSSNCSRRTEGNFFYKNKDIRRVTYYQKR